MNYRLLVFVVSLSVTTTFASDCRSVIATQNGTNTSDSRDTPAQIESIVHEWLSAALKYDTDRLSQLWTDQWVEMHPDGRVINKAEQLAQFRAPGHRLDELHADDIDVRYCTNGAAILTDTTSIKGHMGSNEYSGKYRFIRMFVKEGDRWRAAGAGATPIRVSMSKFAHPKAATPTLSYVAAHHVSRGQTGNSKEELLKLDAEWLHAAGRGDTAFLSRLFTDQMFEVLPDGMIITGQEMLNVIAAQRRIALHVSDIKVCSIYPTMAIVTDRTTLKGAHVNGRDLTGIYRVMRIFVRQDGVWRAAAADMTRLPER